MAVAICTCTLGIDLSMFSDINVQKVFL